LAEMSVTYCQLAKKYNDWQSVRGGYCQLAENQGDLLTGQ
jgi:hypothetical protein